MNIINQFMEAGDSINAENDSDVYHADDLDVLADNDEISMAEEAFMQGYLEV